MSDLSEADLRRVCTDVIEPAQHRLNENLKRIWCGDPPRSHPASPDRATCEWELAQCLSAPPKTCDRDLACTDWLRAGRCAATVRELVDCVTELDTTFQRGANEALRTACGRGPKAAVGRVSLRACNALQAQCPNLSILAIDIYIGPNPAPCRSPSEWRRP